MRPRASAPCSCAMACPLNRWCTAPGTSMAAAPVPRACCSPPASARPASLGAISRRWIACARCATASGKRCRANSEIACGSTDIPPIACRTRRNHRHDEEMLDRALLTLADERGSGQDHGEHGEIVDDLHHRGEPARLEVRVELCAGHDLDRGAHQSLASGDELRDIVDDDVLDVGHAIEGLGHGSGIYVDLNRRLAPRENILLKLWGNFDDEDEKIRIHSCIDFSS